MKRTFGQPASPASAASVDPQRSGSATARSSEVSVVPGFVSTHTLPAGQPTFRINLARSLELHRRLALAIALAFAVLALAYFLRMWPVYVARSLISVQPSTQGATGQNAGQNTGQAAPRAPGDARAFETYILEQMLSVTRNDVLIGALHKLGPGEWQERGESGQAAAERLRRNIEVSREEEAPRGGGYAFSIGARARKPATAAQIANAVTASYLESASRAPADRAPGTVSLAAAATAPLSPARSDAARNAAVILIVGLVCAVLAAVIAHKIDGRVYIASEVEEVLGVAPMAQLPDFAEVTELAAEEYLLRLAADLEHARKLKVCVFTGAGPGAGVTTIVGRVTAMLDAMNEEDGDAGQEPRLSLIDAEPLLVSADTEQQARMADGAIVVIESGVTTRVQLSQVAQTLRRLDLPAVGFVLNRVRLAKAGAAFRQSVRDMEKHLKGRSRSGLPGRATTLSTRTITRSSRATIRPDTGRKVRVNPIASSARQIAQDELRETGRGAQSAAAAQDLVGEAVFRPSGDVLFAAELPPVAAEPASAPPLAPALYKEPEPVQVQPEPELESEMPWWMSDAVPQVAPPQKAVYAQSIMVRQSDAPPSPYKSVPLTPGPDPRASAPTPRERVAAPRDENETIVVAPVARREAPQSELAKPEEPASPAHITATGHTTAAYYDTAARYDTAAGFDTAARYDAATQYDTASGHDTSARYDTATRLGGLKSIISGGGVKKLHKIKESSGPHHEKPAGEAPVQQTEQESEKPAYSTASVPVAEPAPAAAAATATEARSSGFVTLGLSSPAPVRESFEPITTRQETVSQEKPQPPASESKSRRDRREAYDDVQTLPSWRGQYKKR